MFRPTYFVMKTFIKNIEYPFCVNCVHFLYHKDLDPYQPFMNIENSRCKKFGEADLITGVIKYDSVINCRKDDSDYDDTCGVEGKYYESKTKKTSEKRVKKKNENKKGK